MKIVIDKNSLVAMMKVVLYAITGDDYRDIGVAVNELLDQIEYKSIDGLIEFIKESKALRCMGATKQVFIEEKDLFRIIKEYCGGEQK